MSQKSLRIANIANQLFLNDRQRIAIKFLEKRKSQKIIEENTLKLAEYLKKNDKIDFIKNKLELVLSSSNRKNNLLIRALSELEENLEKISKQNDQSQNDMQPKIKIIKDIKKALENLKNLMKIKEVNILSQQITQALLGRPSSASIIIGTTEPLEEDDDDSVEDGVTSQPLEDHEEDE